MSYLFGRLNHLSTTRRPKPAGRVRFPTACNHCPPPKMHETVGTTTCIKQEMAPTDATRSIRPAGETPAPRPSRSAFQITANSPGFHPLQRRASFQTHKGRCSTLIAACFCPQIRYDLRKHAVGASRQRIQAETTSHCSSPAWPVLHPRYASECKNGPVFRRGRCNCADLIGDQLKRPAAWASIV
ncbi:hypothetical protein M728_001584 [Ensifer sp. WSM1721]